MYMLSVVYQLYSASTLTLRPQGLDNSFWSPLWKSASATEKFCETNKIILNEIQIKKLIIFIIYIYIYIY